MAYKGRILARSPYYIIASGTGAISNAQLSVYIWSGLASAKPISPNYIINKTPLQANDEEITFEISELIRDEFNHNYDPYSNSTVDSLWVETSWFVADTTGLTISTDDSYIGLDGYSYFSDGPNDLPDFSYDEIIVNGTDDILIPIQVGADGADSIEFYLDSILKNTQSLTETTDSNTKLMYVTQTRAVFNVDEIRIKDGATTLKTITVTSIDDCQFGSQKINFINENGENQILYAFGKDKTSLSTNNDTYKKDLGSIVTGSYFYDNYKHQQHTFNVSGNESITLNTGWMPESQNVIYKQLLLSEYVWINDRPVKLTSNNLEYKTQRDDKLINYTFNFDYANDIKNTVY